MAGLIHVSAKNGLSTGGPTYLHFIELIREQLISLGCERYVKDIYFGHDESFSDFISVEDQDADGFNCFYEAVVAASNISIARVPEYEKLWQELLGLLRADLRWRSTSRK